jgi:hypothetical protein
MSSLATDLMEPVRRVADELVLDLESRELRRGDVSRLDGASAALARPWFVSLHGSQDAFSTNSDPMPKDWLGT